MDLAHLAGMDNRLQFDPYRFKVLAPKFGAADNKGPGPIGPTGPAGPTNSIRAMDLQVVLW